MHPPAPLSPKNYYKYAPMGEDVHKPYHVRKTCSPFSYGIHPGSPVLHKRKILAEGSYVTEGQGTRPPNEMDYRCPEPEYDYSPANWLEWKKHILAQKHDEDMRKSDKRRTQGRLINELKYSLDAETDGPGKPIVTVIKKDEMMTRTSTQHQGLLHTVPLHHGHGHVARPALKRQQSLPSRIPQIDRDEEYVRPTTPTRVIVPEIVRQMNQISDMQKRELERSESLKNRTRSRTPPPIRRAKSKSPVYSTRAISPTSGPRTYFPPARSSSPHAIATLRAVNESLDRAADHIDSHSVDHKFHSLPARVPVAPIEPIMMPASVTSSQWYHPNMSREAAIAFLKDKLPGAFIVRDSTSYPGAYGLAMKVPDRGEHKTPEECVRHFLIEPAPGGVRVRGSDIEPIFGSLSALVYQHTQTPLSLPYRLILHDNPLQPKSAEKLLESLQGLTPEMNKGFAFMVLYLGCREIGMLTGPHAVKNALDHLFSERQQKSITISAVVMKVNAEGINLTDHERRVFFRMHFPLKNFRFCGMDQAHRHWEYRDELNGDTRKPSCFGVVVSSATNKLENECHMFAEFEQPSCLLVEEINKWGENYI